MLEEVRITGLGVINDVLLELSPGFTALTGETGAGKTMVVTGLSLLLGGRADAARVRPGAQRASVEGRLRTDPRGRIARLVEEAGGDLDEDGTLVLSRSVSIEGRSRAFAGGRSVPLSLLTHLADDLVTVHGQSGQLLRPGWQRESLDKYAGASLPEVLTDYQFAYSRHLEVRAERTARAQAAEAGSLRAGLTDLEELNPAGGEAAQAGELYSDDDTIAALTAEEAELAAQVTDLAERLSRLRAEAGQRFAAAVTTELAALAMPHARISVTFTLLGEPGPYGVDDVEIRLSSHPGAPALPLYKGASGGELSRVMLAIEVVFAGADAVPTFVFDEVDAGAGGKAAVEIGRRLARLARHAQVIVVTHLPQVAAFADNHLVIAVSSDGSVTGTSVVRLEHEGRIRELARMLAGLEDSEFTQAHAAELLAMAAPASLSLGRGDDTGSFGTGLTTADQTSASDYQDFEAGPPGVGNDGGCGSAGSDRGPGDGKTRPRFLTGILPERAPIGARISLLALVTLAAQGASAALKEFAVSLAGTVVTITVSAPGLVPLGDLEQDVTVPFAADSDPVRFGFLAGPAGLHSVRVRVFAGGTCLGDLRLEISVGSGAALEEGRPRTVLMADLAAEPGEVTLQVSRTAAGGYSFQLLSAALYPAVIIDRLAGDPATVIGQLIAELRKMSKATPYYATPGLARRRLRSLGSQLWGDVVPKTIREQFWAQRDRIKLFTIASDVDTVPWELIYPVDIDNDAGFLVEQFPVVRRVYGQSRTRVLRLDRGAGFIVPPKSPTNAIDEVAAVRASLPADVLDRGTVNDLGRVFELLDAVPSVLHFAGHNGFTDELGSLISLDGGPLRPGDLSYARQRHSFGSVSPLVFFNGCRTAGEIPGFTQMIGWAEEFMGAGAGAFIGSLWAVRSTSARTFAEKFYNALVCERQSLGVASLQARRAILADEGDPTWLAYAVYGNPSASVMHNTRTYP